MQDRVDGNWIEEELSRHLTPVKAPDTLWPRIASARFSARRDLRWMLWPAFAGLILLASSEIRYHAQRPTVTTPALVRSVSVRDAREVCLTCHTDRL